MNVSLNLLLDTSTDFFCVLDKTGNIIHTNVTLRNTLGYSDHELTGKNADLVSHPADIKKRGELLMTISPEQKVVIQESRVKSKDGRYFNIKWHLSVNNNDDLIYLLGINLTNHTNGKAKNLLPR